MGAITAAKKDSSQGIQTQVPSLFCQGTTVRIITAIDQDKGRPRGIGYTIVSGKAEAAPSPLTPLSSTQGEPVGVSGSEG